VRYRRRIVLAAVLLCLAAAPQALAQNDRRVFAGALLGVSTLSADGRAVTTPLQIATSSYKPQNGFTIDVLAGVHLAQYFSVQGNYMWNRNDLTLVSAFVTPQGGGFYEQMRRSAQHAVVADGLIYFRSLDSRIRPYLGTGLSVVRFKSSSGASLINGLDPPAGEITSTRLALRSHVGIDLAISPRTVFRYSFSETIGGNPISPHLSPMGERGLANFQNLFGLLTRF
jgi:opacity protein-like surface antigen